MNGSRHLSRRSLFSNLNLIIPQVLGRLSILHLPRFSTKIGKGECGGKFTNNPYVRCLIRVTAFLSVSAAFTSWIARSVHQQRS